MAKQTRSIVGAVQQRDANGKTQTFVSGQEEELNAILPASQIARLAEKGVISGDWTGARTEPTESSATSEPNQDVEGDETDSEEHEDLPTLADLPAHLATIATADEIQALRKTDKRKGAKPMYAARLAEIEAASTEG